MGWLDELKARQSHLKELRRYPLKILKKEYLAVEPLIKNLLGEIERELGFDCNKGQASFEWKRGDINSIAFKEIEEEKSDVYYEYACLEWKIESESIQLIVDKEGVPHL